MNARILIADDEPDMLELLASNLRAAGFSVVETMDGAEALAAPRELILRIRALLRRGLAVPVAPSSTLRAGEIVIDLGRHQVRVGHQPVDLTTIEFKLLAALVRKCEFVLSREALLSSIWGEQYE